MRVIPDTIVIVSIVSSLVRVATKARFHLMTSITRPLLGVDEMTDARYKVTQEDIHEMRHLRKGGMTYEKLATHFGIASSTAVYWCNKEFREKQRKKVAKRTHKRGDQHRIKRDMKKRKQNWLQNPDSKLRHSIQSAKDESRSRRKTVKGIPFEEAEELLDSGDLKTPNSKMED